jgi:hypothetical protein
MYVNKQTLEPVTRSQIKAAHPHTSFPREIPQDWLESHGYAQVIDTFPEPAPGQNSVTDGIELVDGEYRQKWRYEDVPIPEPEELEIRLAAIETKLEITEENKQAARAALIDERKR